MDKWNVIFLLDKTPPEKILLLKRAPDKKFAPGMYTGIGGKVEPGETLLQSAHRELQEETGLKNISLTEFGRAIIDNYYSLHYFWGILPKNILPDTTEGTLEWTSIDELLSKEIIPTTLQVCRYWSERAFDISGLFTLNMKTISEENGLNNVEITFSAQTR